MTTMQKSALATETKLRRLDLLILNSEIDEEERTDLKNRRILGIIKDTNLNEDIEESLQENLTDLDFSVVKGDNKRLLEVLKRFFKNKNVKLQSISTYYDRSFDVIKENIYIINVEVGGIKTTCYLKEMEESPRRECLGLRVNNLLTDSPIPFMARGNTSLQIQVRGTPLDVHFGFKKEEDKEKFHFNLGKADEFGKLIQLGDRKAEDIMILRTRVAHVDYGASFSRHESIKRFIEKIYEEQFNRGPEKAREIIKIMYKRNSAVLYKLLSYLDERIIRIMNQENKRKAYPIEINPKDIIYDYLHEIGC